MRKIVCIFIGIMMCINSVYADVFTENISNGCMFLDAPTLVANFEPKQYTCASGYYLPANHDGCEPCPSGQTCGGGTYTFNESLNQGIIYSLPIENSITNACVTNLLVPIGNTAKLSATFTPNTHNCSAGYYMPANTDGCVACPTGHTCAGGTYTFNETTDQGITVNQIEIIWQDAAQADVTANDAQYVTYGTDIRTPANPPPHIPGKVFTGWKFIPAQ